MHERGTISMLAMDALAALPSTSSIERVFNVSGLIVSKLRNKLSLEKVRELLCLNLWYKAGV